MSYPRLAKHNAGIAAAAAGSILGTSIETGGITKDQIAADAVESAEIKDGAVTPAKLSDHYINSAGVTIAALTAAIAAPATLVDGTIYVIRDTADSNKIKLVVVAGSAFYVGAALTAAA